MRIFGIEIKRDKKEKRSTDAFLPAYTGDGFSSWLGNSSKPMLLSTVYRCVDLISDSLAVLPLETFALDNNGFKTLLSNDPVYRVLNLEPNDGMSRFVFFKTLMASVLLTGNGYAYIERNTKNEVEQLHYLQSNDVTAVWIKIGGIKRKRYQVAGFNELVEPRDMIHVLNFSYDGITGVPTLTHARQTLGVAGDSEAHAAGFFKSGANTSGILTIEGARLTKEQKQQIYTTWQERTNPITGKPNGIVVLEGNQKYQPISISPKDSQLLESRQFNVIEICRFFSVSPVKAFDLSKSSYSTIEATQLEFLNDTLLPVITKFETEINRKVFLPTQWGTRRAEFNTSVLLRADKTSQSNYWNTMFQIGAASPNEIRRELNLSRIENGDDTFVQVNVQTLKNATQKKNNI